MLWLLRHGPGTKGNGGEVMHKRRPDLVPIYNSLQDDAVPLWYAWGNLFLFHGSGRLDVRIKLPARIECSTFETVEDSWYADWHGLSTLPRRVIESCFHYDLTTASKPDASSHDKKTSGKPCLSNSSPIQNGRSFVH